ncbi:hypothetical protein Mesil_0872 [Allomeiothermus silvanus DSM 9946]|uniref:Uncharacterized protein n=1 Tax=Allomeiothermus silvanus (strain ATCC 700542 / DSM 9946 / NBRC 106475 / NCIMB 13440 / VI-R2) TaxID=526227 RepID=D7BBY8_ALLS1|nr:hypothetical protein Mesil_0872 [Allomeiothermus silvanus DSM 9946]
MPSKLQTTKQLIRPLKLMTLERVAGVVGVEVVEAVPVVKSAEPYAEWFARFRQ